jgi:hypothetical protein
MTRLKKTRDRGRILTDRGLKKIRDAINKKFTKLEKKPTPPAISEQTSFCNNCVSSDTVRNVLNQQPTDKSSIETLFTAFGLTLDEDDYKSPISEPECLNSSPNIDLSEAPDVSMSTFYGHEEQLTTLEQWIVNERCRLVVLSGMPGIGKSSLARRLADKIKDKFEYVIWRSLYDAPSLNEFLADLIQFLSNQQGTEADLPEQEGRRLSQLMEYLHKHRCLLILDDVELIMQEGTLAGHFCDGYKWYGQLLQLVRKQQHQSCLILITQEQPKDIASVAREALSLRPFRLESLEEEAVRKILQEQGLSEPVLWGDLIKKYGGNPFALKLVSAKIKKDYGGMVSKVLTLRTTLQPNQLRELLDEQFRCLTRLEKMMMYWLVCEGKPVSLLQLCEDMPLPESYSDLQAAKDSLEARSLIENPEYLLNLHPIIRSYVKKQIIEFIYLEIKGFIENKTIENINGLKDLNLTNSQSKILEVIQYKLCKPYSLSKKDLSTLLNQIRELLSILGETSRRVGYAERNLENLIERIQSNLNIQ